MKHNTHIYLATKAIEFTRSAVDNLQYTSGRKARPKSLKRKKRKYINIFPPLSPDQISREPEIKLSSMKIPIIH